MTFKMTKEELFKLIADALKVDRNLIGENTMKKDLSFWDSLGTMMLMVALEQRANIKLSVKEMNQFQGVPDIIKRLNL